MKFFIIIFLGGVVFCATANAEKICVFDSGKNQYQGTRSAQAACLLRKVNRFGKLSAEVQLPETIKFLMESKKVEINKADFREYLVKYNISEEDIGGSISKPLNVKTVYFIIHDTSSPNYKEKEIPENVNDATWNGNDLLKYSAKAHVYINRVGESATKVNMSENMRATKFELASDSRKNVFLNVELIQPRRSYPDGSKKNDATAPLPGFTSSQMHRLATVYLAASMRAGFYLVPAFHSVVDTGFESAHDDPQNFDINNFDKALQDELKKIKSL